MYSILCFGQCSCFVCVQLSLQSGLSSVLIHHGHRVALSDVLCNIPHFQQDNPKAQL